MEKNKQIRLGIIYIATGIYDEFWKDFYPSCECYFCPDVIKGYEVFTDSVRLQSMTLKNVIWHPVKDRGFIRNVSAKSEFICSVAKVIEEKYDYIFFLNGNFKFIEPIYSEEILPDESNDYITALSFDLNKHKTPDELSYDRNPDCNAYIPKGQGKRYYQGGLYGGRTQEIIQMSEWIKERIDEDLSKKIIARWHDESYVNKYLKDRNPRVLNETYAFVEEIMPYRPHKNIVLEKKKYLGKRLDEYKDLSIDNSVSFMLDDDLNLHKIGIVKTQGRLGNQMFQYAYLSYLRKQLGTEMDFYLFTNNEILSKSFPLIELFQMSENLKKSVNHVNPRQIEKVTEAELSTYQHIDKPKKAITIYSGYWQCYNYANELTDELREAFQMNEDALCYHYKCLLEEISSICSVSIHIRRGDYNINKNKDIYGSICNMEYYSKAIKEMKKLLPEKPVFYVFTDDKEWVRNHFIRDGYVLIESTEDIDDWQDLFLMSSCKHHIIANSSFSWWGAWLGHYENKIVIAPDRWYNGMSTPDILPLEWIRIPIKSSQNRDKRLAANLLFNKIMPNSDMPYWNEMTRVIYHFYLAEKMHKSYYRKEAYSRLEDLLKHLGRVTSIDELIKISCAIVYLYNKKYIKGNSNHMFEQLDNLFKNKITTCNYQILIKIAEYFTLRLECKDSREKTEPRIEFTLECIFKRLWENRRSLSRPELHMLFKLLHTKQYNDSEDELIDELYIYCMRYYNISNLMFINKGNETSIFL